MSKTCRNCRTPVTILKGDKHVYYCETHDRTVYLDGTKACDEIDEIVNRGGMLKKNTKWPDPVTVRKGLHKTEKQIYS